ncbi:MAG: HAMP domain-containing sensor histidine kinase [Cyanobacteria bacterium P01_F01_bin.33]
MQRGRWLQTGNMRDEVHKGFSGKSRKVQGKSFVSLKAKLLIAFSMVFCAVSGGMYVWFYTYSTARAIERMEGELEHTARGAAKGIDIEKLLALYEEGEPNEDGFSDDPRYQQLLAWLDAVHQIEPKAWPYTYIVVEDSSDARYLAGVDEPNLPHTLYLVDVWANYDVDSAAAFLDIGNASKKTMEAYRSGEIIHRELYSDEYGSWMSAYLPLKDKDENVVAMLGVDIEADYVRQIQRYIREEMLIAFLVSYSILALLIILISNLLTKRLTHLTSFAQKIGEGDYSRKLKLSNGDIFTDEMSILSDVFNGTIESIRRREEVIREGKEIENEIRIALEEERELNELKSRFVSMVSHELRTPLTVIQTSNEMLDKFKEKLNNSKRDKYHTQVRESVKNMTDLLEDVLFIGKSESQKMQLAPESIDLIEYSQKLIENLKLADSENHTVDFSCIGQTCNIFVDRKCLHSILSNLISNAFKYSPSNSVVDFCLRFEDDIVTVEVRDRGIGIPEKDQPHLFELFHRASNARNIRGTGLGLAIVAQCVNHLQGDVNFWSKMNLGTIFTVKLPLKMCLKAEDIEVQEITSDELAATTLLSSPSTELIPVGMQELK